MYTHELTLSQVRLIYDERMAEDFPPDELKPLAMIEDALARGVYVCYGYFVDAEILAYAFIIKRDRWALVDYLAVRRDLRNQGVGSRFLRELIPAFTQATDVSLLEVDAPGAAPTEQEREHRRHRLQFYLRNGLWETGVSAAVYGVDFDILALPVGDQPDADTVKQVYAEMYHTILPDELYEQWVRT